MLLTEALTRTLLMVSDAVAGCEDPWWVIGSCALALHGVNVGEVRDVDLLMSVADAELTTSKHGGSVSAGSPSDHFRSTIFWTWREPPLPVEVMAGFSVAVPAGWASISPASRHPVLVGARELFVPSMAELREILISFGRPKDLQRLHLLND